MNGTLPIFLFFMKKMMAAMVGCDYERGLNMLKEYIETGSVVSQITMKGVVDQTGFHYIGINQSCAMDDVASSMEQAFSKIRSEIENKSLSQPDIVLSIYHTFDMVRGHCEYTAACGYIQPPGQSVPEGMIEGQIKDHRALKVDHTGPYLHLGNAWSAAMGCQRTDKLKLNKSVSMYEIYVNDPHEVDENDLVTSIFIPVK